MGARRYTAEELYEACRRAYNSEVIRNEPLAGERRSVGERLAASLGLEIEPDLPEMIQAVPEPGMALYPSCSGWGSEEAKWRGYREAARRYNVVGEILRLYASRPPLITGISIDAERYRLALNGLLAKLADGNGK